MTDVPFTHALRGIALAICAVLMLHGCASTPMERARTTISVAAESVVSVDRVIAPRYAAASAREYESEDARADALRPWNRAVTSLLLARSAILSAERTLDAIEAGQDGDIMGTLACVASALMRIVDALPAINVELPEVLTMAMNLVGSVAGTCEPDDEVSLRGVPHVSEAIAVSP